MSTIDLSWIATRLVSDIRDIIMSEVRLTCMETLQHYIQQGVYSDPEGRYRRTKEFLNAVDVKNIVVGNTSATFDLVVDPSKMNLYHGTSDSDWGKHVINRTEDFREGLITVLEEGGGAYRNFAGHEPGRFFENTYRDLDKNLVNILADALSARGWTVSA